MSGQITAVIKLQIEGGKANPAPPVGPALGQRQVNIMNFCKEFNGKTQDRIGDILPVIITVYSDKTYSLVIKEEPASCSIKKLAKITSGSKTPGKGDGVAVVKKADLIEIAKRKINDLNCFGNIDSAVKMLMGTAKSMGVKVED